MKQKNIRPPQQQQPFSTNINNTLDTLPVHVLIKILSFLSASNEVIVFQQMLNSHIRQVLYYDTVAVDELCKELTFSEDTSSIEHRLYPKEAEHVEEQDKEDDTTTSSSGSLSLDMKRLSYDSSYISLRANVEGFQFPLKQVQTGSDDDDHSSGQDHENHHQQNHNESVTVEEYHMPNSSNHADLDLSSESRSRSNSNTSDTNLNNNSVIQENTTTSLNILEHRSKLKKKFDRKELMSQEWNTYHIMILGPLGVGKTSILQRFISRTNELTSSGTSSCSSSTDSTTLTDTTTTTTSAQTYIAQQKKTLKRKFVDPFKLEINDVSEASNNQCQLASADGYLLVFSLSDKASFEQLPHYYKIIRQARKSRLFPCLIVANKCDINERCVKHDEVLKFVQRKARKNILVQYRECSAYQQKDVDLLFSDMLQVMQRYRADKAEVANYNKSTNETRKTSCIIS